MMYRAITLAILAFLLCGWTFSFIDKPGSEWMVKALQAREAGQDIQAYRYFQKAAKTAVDFKTKGRAWRYMAQLKLQKQLDNKQSIENTLRLLHQANQLGERKARLVLGDMFRLGQGVPVDKAVARKHYAALQAQDPAALIALSRMTEDSAQAKAYLVQAADAIAMQRRPSERAMRELAKEYVLGEAWPRDMRQAERLFTQLAERDAENSHQISRWYDEQAQQEPLFASYAEEWMQRAAELGVARALLLKAREAWRAVKNSPSMVEREPHFQRAKRFYQLAAAQGNDKAREEFATRQQRMWRRDRAQLQRLLEPDNHDGSHPIPHFTQTAHWQPLAEAGDAFAMMQLGKARLYASDGEAQKTAQGLVWMQKAARAGEAEAMHELSQLYQTGLGGVLDAEKSLHWLEQAAQAGNAEAQYDLGIAYARGQGVPQSRQQARHWLRQAQQQGYPYALKILSALEQGMSEAEAADAP